MSDLKCPYCETDVELCHDDGYGYEENCLHQQDCGHCGKTFAYTTEISFYFEPYKADCLNEGNHEWKPTRTHPKEWTMMRCETCWEERKPTEEEWKDILKPIENT